MAKEDFKAVRLKGRSLALATELIEDFRLKGLRATWTSVVDTSIPLLHAQLHGQNYTMVSNAELAERRAYDVGTSVAAILGALCTAQVDMSGCQLGYIEEVEAIVIRLEATGDILMPIGGLDPTLIANVVKTQLLNRGYLNDDGAVIVDMEKLLGEPAKGT